MKQILLIVTIAATTVELGGVLLRWDHVQEPYAHNFVQYRPVVNLTASLSYNDTITPWTTLPVIPQEMSSMLVPANVLVGGAYYEFRLGFQSGLHTSVSNTLVAKTFDASSPFVSNVMTEALDTILTVSWGEPVYNDDIVGYSLSIYYLQPGNAGVSNQQWGASVSTLVTSLMLPLTQRSLTYGCADLSASDCLTPYTTYLVDIAVIRTTGHDAPRSLFVSTQHPIESLHNTSSIYLYALTITMNFTVSVPWYGQSTPVNATFLHPLNLHTTRSADLSINLTRSMVTSVSSTSIKIILSLPEYEYITAATIYYPPFLFTPFMLRYGPAQTVEPCSVHCLS